MAHTSTSTNMMFIPDNADIDLLLFFLPIPELLPTYKATCPSCHCRTHTHTRDNRDVYCDGCLYVNARVLQAVFRGRSVRRKYNRIRGREGAYRWFLRNGVNGSDIARKISQYL